MKNFLKNENVLVTGAMGLVGGHLTESLLKQGANVFVTYRSLHPRSYFSGRKLQEKVVSLVCDINDPIRVFDIVAKYEISHIFHVAAQALVTYALANPYETFLTNIMGTVNVLEAARRSPHIKAVIVASSDKAYGKNCVDATEDQKLEGDHPYDVSKSSADLIARAYYKTYGLPVAVSRFGNIFGPGDLNMNRLVPGLIKAIIHKKLFEIRSDGKFTRDYVYVKDVADGYIALAKNIEKVKGEAFNFSAGYNFSVEDFVKKINGILGEKAEYKIINNQKNEIPAQSLNFEKAKKVLGWQSRYTLEEGIKETFKWYKDYFENKS